MTDLSKISFFKHFPKSLLDRLSQCVQIIHLSKGDVLIEQGNINKNLYFLSNGELSVFVDGSLVADLDKLGDSIGEMSLITKQRSGATIRAKKNTELFKIEGASLQALTQNEGDTFNYNLFRVYADVLAQKLEVTNQRAKLAEVLNSDLQLAQADLLEANNSLEVKVLARTHELEEKNKDLTLKNEEISASHNKMKDLFSNHEATYETLESILTHQLKPLEEHIGNFQADGDSDAQFLHSMENKVFKAIQQLEPLTRNYVAEKSMKSQKVLIAESNRKQHTVAKMALGGTGVQLDIAGNVEDAEALLAKNSYDILLFDEQLTNVAKKVQQSATVQPKFVFVTSDDVANYLPKVLDLPFFPNIVSRDEEDRQFTIKNFVTTVSKLASANYFGLEKYLSWGVEVHEKMVSSSGQRAGMIKDMEGYFKKIGIRSVRLSQLAVVAEELLMNAIYDAPVDSKGISLFNHLHRIEAVDLTLAQQARFRYASDGVLMAISVEDPFGGLDAETVFKYLERCYEGGGSLNDGNQRKGGGGRGLHQIVENSDLVVFNIQPNMRTEVIALFNTDRKVADKRNPNLHFFTLD